MRKRTILTLVAIAAVALITVGCDALFGGLPLSDGQRAAAFIEDANASPRDPLDMQSHFHPTQVTEYSSMNTDAYWSGSFFDFGDRTFTVTELTSGGEVAGFPGTTSLTGSITSPNVSATPITFGFLADPENSDNRLIRVIIVESLDTIQNVR